MAKIKVSVTEEDIAKGKALDANACPLARAIRRVAAGRPWVGITMIGQGENQSAPMPSNVRAFRSNFDFGGVQRKRCKPFTFTISAPWLRKRAKKGKKK